jgi:hypothetical protein
VTRDDNPGVTLASFEGSPDLARNDPVASEALGRMGHAATLPAASSAAIRRGLSQK